MLILFADVYIQAQSLSQDVATLVQNFVSRPHWVGCPEEGVHKPLRFYWEDSISPQSVVLVVEEILRDKIASQTLCRNASVVIVSCAHFFMREATSVTRLAEEYHGDIHTCVCVGESVTERETERDRKRDRKRSSRRPHTITERQREFYFQRPIIVGSRQWLSAPSCPDVQPAVYFPS